MKQCNCKRCTQKRQEEERKVCKCKQNREEKFQPEVDGTGRCEKYTKEIIYEDPVYCTIEEKHYHHHVKHVVPIIYKKVENHHVHHEYVIDKKFKEEVKETNHGKFNGDFCELGKKCGERPDKGCDEKPGREKPDREKPDREKPDREKPGKEKDDCDC